MTVVLQYSQRLKMVRLFLVVILVVGLGAVLACGGGKPGATGDSAPPPAPVSPVPDTTPPAPVSPVPDVTPPPSVPVVPNDSIVTAEVIGITQVSNGFNWQITIQLLGSQDVAGYHNLTKSRVGQEIVALTKEDVSRLQVGETITAHLRVGGDERGIIFLMWNISSQG